MKKQNEDLVVAQRRDFLKVVAAAGISQALLRASTLIPGIMMSRMAEAQSSTLNKAVLIYTPDGAIPHRWHPDASLNSFPPMSAPYADVRDYCHFVDNVNADGLGHGILARLINKDWSGGDSWDVNMGKILGANTPFKYVNLGVHSQGNNKLSRDNGNNLAFDDNPFVTFKRLFGNGGSSSADPKKTSVLNAHKEALAAIKNKLGSYEQQRLDAHLTAISETEKRLVDMGGGSCGSPNMPAEFPIEYATIDKQFAMNGDIALLALQCNLIASASLSISNDTPDAVIPHLNWKDSIHNSIHGANQGDRTNYPDFTEVRAELSRYNVNFIKKMIDAGLINSTLIVQISDMGHGDSHDSKRVPIVLTSGAGITKRINTSGNCHVHDILHTSAVALRANQSALYQPLSNNVVSGILA